LISLDEDGTYSVKKTSSQGEEMQRIDTYYKKEQFQGFISEGQLLGSVLSFCS